ncbi:MAG: flagellar biosynthetic protein FliO [Deltaproteobacteria bacterium]|nr:flagellar biosynthetic protein FliO [Deltaproteobacteria bacterium]
MRRRLACVLALGLGVTAGSAWAEPPPPAAAEAPAPEPITAGKAGGEAPPAEGGSAETGGTAPPARDPHEQAERAAGQGPAETGGTAPPARDPRLEAENAEVIRLAADYDGDLAAVGGPDQDEREAPSMGGALVQMFFVLGAVIILVYLLLGKLLPKVLKIPMPGQQPRMMRVVDRLPIDQRRSILVVAVGDDYFMVGASEGGINLISRLDAQSVQQAAGAAQPSGPSGLSRFAEALTGRGKES